MKIGEYDSNISIVSELGSRLKKYRIALSKTQDDLCNLSGVSIATIKGFENGKGCSLDTFIKLLKALDLCSNLNDVIPVIEMSPNDYAVLGKERQRFYKKKKDVKPIVWGEDK